jgi:hypothetical protein
MRTVEELHGAAGPRICAGCDLARQSSATQACAVSELTASVEEGISFHIPVELYPEICTVNETTQ